MRKARATILTSRRALQLVTLEAATPAFITSKSNPLLDETALEGFRVEGSYQPLVVLYIPWSYRLQFRRIHSNLRNMAKASRQALNWREITLTCITDFAFTALCFACAIPPR
jgi:hypothetical protein